jgi:hypothetical protein
MTHFALLCSSCDCVSGCAALQVMWWFIAITYGALALLLVCAGCFACYSLFAVISEQRKRRERV